MEDKSKFDVVLYTLGPIHIGDGQVYSKNSYIVDNQSYYFPQMEKIFAYCEKKHPQLVQNFENYLMNSKPMPLKKWLYQNHIEERTFGGYKIKNTNPNLKVSEISQFIRDAYHQPYIPGSSLKGALRTVISNQMNWYKDVENHDANVNKFFQGIHVSDSQTLSNDDLIICSKYLWSIRKDKKPKSLPVHWQAIKPGSKIHFTVTCYGKDQIEMMRNFDQLARAHYQKYYDYYLKDLRKDYIQNFRKEAFPYIYLGGGSGFWTKVLIDIANPSRHEKGKLRMIDKGAYKLTRVTNVSKELINNQDDVFEMGKCGVAIREREWF